MPKSEPEDNKGGDDHLFTMSWSKIKRKSRQKLCEVCEKELHELQIRDPCIWDYEENETELNDADKDSGLWRLQQKVYRVPIENFKLKHKLENTVLEAEMVKRDFLKQIQKLETEAKVKDREHVLELALERSNAQITKTGRKDAPIGTFVYEKNKFPWLKLTKFQNIPSEIQQEVLTYLEDEELFQLRSQNKIFYSAFFDQRVVSGGLRWFYYRRALKLATMGRIFKNVEFFDFSEFPYDPFRDDHCFSYCNSYSELLTPDQFPNLKELVLSGDFDLDSSRPFRKLRLIKQDSFSCGFWQKIIESNLPALEKIIFDRTEIVKYCKDFGWGNIEITTSEGEDFMEGEIQELRSQGLLIVEK